MAQRILTPMTSNRRRRRSRGVRTLTVAMHVATLLALSPFAYAGGMAVLDASNLTQNTMTAANMIKQVEQAVAAVKQLTTLNGALGAAASSVNVQVPSWNNMVTSTAGGVKPTFDSWNLPKDISASINSPQAAQEFVTKALDIPLPAKGKTASPLKADDLQRIQVSRKAAQREVALRALATAQNAEATASDASQNANSILSLQNANLREQTAQLTQAVVNVNQELIQMRLVNAGLLELLSTNTIRDLPLGVGDTVSDLRTQSQGKSGDGSNSNPFE